MSVDRNLQAEPHGGARLARPGVCSASAGVGLSASWLGEIRCGWWTGRSTPGCGCRACIANSSPSMATKCITWWVDRAGRWCWCTGWAAGPGLGQPDSAAHRGRPSCICRGFVGIRTLRAAQGCALLHLGRRQSWSRGFWIASTCSRWTWRVGPWADGSRCRSRCSIPSASAGWCCWIARACALSWVLIPLCFSRNRQRIWRRWKSCWCRIRGRCLVFWPWRCCAGAMTSGGWSVAACNP